LRVRAGEAVDPRRWATAQMGEWVDQYVTGIAAAVNSTKNERSWDYYKLGRERHAETPDLRHKGWKEAVGTRG
jgi:hypothetical protein